MEECFNQRKLIASEFKNYRKVFTALGDENRQQIFLVLLENDKVGMRVPEITKKTHLSRPAVSHHLQILKEAELVNMHRVGDNELLLCRYSRKLLEWIKNVD